MQHYLMILALDVANERVREAEEHRLARAGGEGGPSRLRRILDALAGNGRVPATSHERPRPRPA